MTYEKSALGGKESDDRKLQRDEMVSKHLEAKGIKNNEVLNAFRRIPRHLFVPQAFVSRAYDDDAVPIGSGQTISKPYIIARMIEAADPSSDRTVLEIGTGSGYQAALLSLLFRHVYSLERIDTLSRETSKRLKELGYTNVTVRTFDGTYGWSAMAPYDAIIVSAAAPSLPNVLIKQLKDGGKLVCPVGDDKKQVLVVVTREGDDTVIEELGSCRFVPLIGRYGWNEPK